MHRIRIDQCPHHRSTDVEADGSAVCGILSSILSMDGGELVTVQQDACEACCRDFEPSAEAPNTVVASLLFGSVLKILERGGVPGCPVSRAEELRELAHDNLRFEDGEPRVDYERALARVDAACTCFDASRASDVVTFERCDWCRERSPANGREDLPELRTALPSLATDGAPSIRQWAVGVITAPRRRSTLDWCLDSVIRAGWDQPRIFADGDVPVASRHEKLPRTVRSPAVGAWPNYYLALTELAMREPEADAFLLLEDDALLYDRECVREYLERSLRFDERTGMVSLYCSMAYTRETSGWFAPEEPWLWGALAFVFPRRAVKALLGDADVIEHRWGERGLRDADVVLGEWAARRELSVHFPTPSLVQHIGEISTIWRGGRARAQRRANRFLGDAFYSAVLEES